MFSSTIHFGSCTSGLLCELSHVLRCLSSISHGLCVCVCVCVCTPARLDVNIGTLNDTEVGWYGVYIGKQEVNT